jgi:hypothetical protein
MEKMNFTVDIHAPKEKVWKTLWEDDTYRKWTRVFSEGSHAETDWNEGSKVLFLDGKDQGMVSKVQTNRPNEFMSVVHLGTVKNGVEDTGSGEVKQWAGAEENYSLSENGGVTTLAVELDTEEAHKDYFMKIFPQALEQVKLLSEQDQ